MTYTHRVDEVHEGEYEQHEQQTIEYTSGGQGEHSSTVEHIEGQATNVYQEGEYTESYEQTYEHSETSPVKSNTGTCPYF